MALNKDCSQIEYSANLTSGLVLTKTKQSNEKLSQIDEHKIILAFLRALNSSSRSNT